MEVWVDQIEQPVKISHMGGIHSENRLGVEQREWRWGFYGVVWAPERKRWRWWTGWALRIYIADLVHATPLLDSCLSLTPSPSSSSLLTVTCKGKAVSRFVLDKYTSVFLSNKADMRRNPSGLRLQNQNLTWVTPVKWKRLKSLTTL